MSAQQKYQNTRDYNGTLQNIKFHLVNKIEILYILQIVELRILQN